MTELATRRSDRKRLVWRVYGEGEHLLLDGDPIGYAYMSVSGPRWVRFDSAGHNDVEREDTIDAAKTALLNWAERLLAEARRDLRKQLRAERDEVFRPVIPPTHVDWANRLKAENARLRKAVGKIERKRLRQRELSGKWMVNINAANERRRVACQEAAREIESLKWALIAEIGADRARPLIESAHRQKRESAPREPL